MVAAPQAQPVQPVQPAVQQPVAGALPGQPLPIQGAAPVQPAAVPGQPQGYVPGVTPVAGAVAGVATPGMLGAAPVGTDYPPTNNIK